MSSTFEESFKSYVTSVQTMNMDVTVSSIHGILSAGIFKWLGLVLPIFGLVTFLSIAGNCCSSRLHVESAGVQF